MTGNYYNLNNAPPHTYNNPDICNNIYGFYGPCNENDTISSARNRSYTRDIRVFNDAAYSGGFDTMYSLSDLSLVLYNNQISSFCWNDGTAGVGACSF